MTIKYRRRYFEIQMTTNLTVTMNDCSSVSTHRPCRDTAAMVTWTSKVGQLHMYTHAYN